MNYGKYNNVIILQNNQNKILLVKRFEWFKNYLYSFFLIFIKINVWRIKQCS